MRGGLPLESLFEIEVPFPEKENNSELKSAALLQSKLQRLCAADFDSIHLIRCSDYKSLRRACLAVDLLDLKLFPQTKACTTRVRFEIEDLVTNAYQCQSTKKISFLEPLLQSMACRMRTLSTAAEHAL